MKVDLYTDAGVKDGLATWGAVCSPTGRGLVERCGRMRDDLADTTAAELRAMANGLHSMIRAGVIEREDCVRLICDNVRAVAVVNGANIKLGRKRDRRRGAIEKLRELADAAGIALKAAFVKGHQRISSEDPHAPFNRRADELCTQARKDKSPPKPKPAGPTKAQRALAIARQLEGRV